MTEKILIVDDHKLFSDGLSKLLREEFIVSDQVYKGNLVFGSIKQNKPDLILLDINLSKLNGLDLAEKIKKCWPEIKIAMVSMYSKPSLIKRAKKLGLEGYFLKNTDINDLKTGVRKILQGETSFISEEPNITIIPFDDFQKKNLLTPREIEIIRLFKEGLDNKQISKKLAISYDTVKTHRKNIYAKLNISNIGELIQFAYQNNLQL